MKLAPKERAIINDSVLENDVRRSRFSVITPSAQILWLKDAIRPEDATTPIMRLCYQLILAGSVAYLDVARHINSRLINLGDIFQGNYCQGHLGAAQKAVAKGRFYKALKSVKLIRPIEERLLSRFGAKV